MLQRSTSFRLQQGLSFLAGLEPEISSCICSRLVYLLRFTEEQPWRGAPVEEFVISFA